MIRTGRVLVAIGVSDLSEEIVHYSHRIAHEMNLTLDFVHVFEPIKPGFRGFRQWIPDNIFEDARKSYRYKVKKWLMAAEERYPDAREHKHEIFIEEGNPAEKVIEKAQEGNYSLIITGSKDENTMKEVLVGSTAAKIGRYAKCSVLLYRSGDQSF